MANDGQNDSLGMISVITGLLSVVFLLAGCCGIPMVGFIGVAFAIVALLTGYLALQKGGDPTMPYVGMGSGCVTLLLQVAILGCAFTALGAYFLAIFAAILFGN